MLTYRLLMWCKDFAFLKHALFLKRLVKNSEYDQEIPQSQTADKPMAPRARATHPSRDTRQKN